MSNSQPTQQCNREDLSGLKLEFMSFYGFSIGYDFRSRDLTFGILMICIFLVFITIGCFLNGVVVMFYKSKSKDDTVSLVYTMLACADIAVSIGSTITMITLILYLSIDMKEMSPNHVIWSMTSLAYASFVVSGFSIRISIILNVILSVIRTVMISNPFRQIQRKVVIAVLVALCVIWILLICTDVSRIRSNVIDKHWDKVFDKSNNLKAGVGDVTPGLLHKARKQYMFLWSLVYTATPGQTILLEILAGKGMSYSWRETAEIVIPFTLFTITFIIPTIIAITCLVLQYTYLRRSRITTNSPSASTSEVTTTIVLLTTLFVVSNTITIIYTSVTAVKVRCELEDELMGFYRGMFVADHLVPLLNSAFSPMILIWRGRAIRIMLKRMMNGNHQQGTFIMSIATNRVNTSL